MPRRHLQPRDRRRRRPDWPVRRGKTPHADHGDCRRTPCPIRSGLFEDRPKNVIVLPVLFEDRVKAVIELASLSAFHRVAPGLPRTAHLIHRHRAQLHRSHDADRGPAEAVAAARHRTADAAEGTAADQRAAGAEGAAAGRTELRSGTQEPGNRAGAPRSRRKGPRARPYLEVQVGIPGQHVARAAHAAQLHPGARPAARRKPRRQPDAASKSNSPAPFTAPEPTCSTSSATFSISPRSNRARCRSRPKRSSSARCSKPSRGRSATRQRTASSVFEVYGDPQLGRSLVTDSKRLQQVLKNLLSNAFKFTEQGGVRLNVSSAQWRLERRSSHPLPAPARSSPSRFPIPASESRRRSSASSSRPSSRPTPATSRKYGGTGLGLAISRELASLLGGEIQLRSTPGNGSTFTLYLPIKPMSVPALRPEAGGDGGRGGAAPSIRRDSISCLERSVEPIPDDRMDISRPATPSC